MTGALLISDLKYSWKFATTAIHVRLSVSYLTVFKKWLYVRLFEQTPLIGDFLVMHPDLSSRCNLYSTHYKTPLEHICLPKSVHSNSYRNYPTAWAGLKKMSALLWKKTLLHQNNHPHALPFFYYYYLLFNGSKNPCHLTYSSFNKERLPWLPPSRTTIHCQHLCSPRVLRE